MRKTIALSLAALALLVALAAPAVAAPTKKSYTWNVTCGQNTFTVKAPLGAPGWPDISKSPILLEGGTFTVTENGVTSVFSDPVPSGLTDQVQTCSIDGPVGVDPNVLHISTDPAYMLFTG